MSDDGVEITARGDGEIEIIFPVFEFDGQSHTEIFQTEKITSVSYKGFKCNYSTNGKMLNKNQVYANRNGRYTAVAAVGDKRVCLKIEIVKE